MWLEPRLHSHSELNSKAAGIIQPGLTLELKKNIVSVASSVADPDIFIRIRIMLFTLIRIQI
jgi:hypothetical protein